MSLRQLMMNDVKLKLNARRQIESHLVNFDTRFKFCVRRAIDRVITQKRCFSIRMVRTCTK